MDISEYEAWALQDNHDLFTAAALWCKKNPYYCGTWDDEVFSQISVTAMYLLKEQLIAENYPVDKRNAVLLEVGKKIAHGKSESLEIISKFMLSREQLKAIAKQKNVKPEFLFPNDSYLIANPPKNTDLESKTNNELYNEAPELDTQSAETKPVSGENVAGSQGDSVTKSRKKLKPLLKARNECLLLIYEITTAKNIKYLDELPGVSAWGLIVGEFESDNIKTRPTLNGTIIFSDGSKASRADFLECYRRRFSQPKQTDRH